MQEKTNSRKKRRKKWLRYLAGCLLLSCLLTCTAVFSDFGRTGRTVDSVSYSDLSMPESAYSVLDQVNQRAVHSTVTGRTVTPASEDVRLYYRFFAGETRRIRSLAVVLEEALDQEAEAVLYYPNPDGEYESACKVVFTLPAGGTTLYFDLPEEADYEMAGFRLDFDETFTIADIRVSAEPLTQDHVLYCAAWPVPVYFAACFALSLGALWLFKRRRAALWTFFRKNAVTIGRFALFAALCAALGNAALFLAFWLSGKAWNSWWFCLVTLFCGLGGLQLGLLHPLPAGSGRKQGEAAPVLRRLLFWGLIAVFVLLIVFEWSEGVLDAPEDAQKLRFVFPYVLAAGETVLLALLYRKYLFSGGDGGALYLRTYLLTALLLGLGYLFVFLPFVSPDEPSHYVSAYRLSNFFLGKFSQWTDSSLLMRAEDYEFFSLGQQELSGEYYRQVTESFHVFAADADCIAVDASMVTNSAFAYLASGLGIAVARVLHLSAVMTFYAARAANLAAFLLTLYLMLKLVPSGRTAFYAIAMTPMMLHTVSSCSYDTLTFCYVALFAAQVLRMALNRQPVSRREYRVCLLLAALMAPSKFVYAPLLLLIFLVPASCFGGFAGKAWKKKLSIVGCGACSAAAALLLTALANGQAVVRTVTGTGEAAQVISVTGEPCYTVSWILEHLWDYVLLNVRTLILQGSNYFLNMFGSKLGWLDVTIPTLYVVISIILFLFAVSVREGEPERALRDSTEEPGKTALDGAGEPEKMVLDGAGKCWIVLLCCGTAAALFLVMAVCFTPESYDFIAGVQGRYFLPLLVPLIWVLRSGVVRAARVLRRYIVLAETLLNIWILVYLFTSCVL